MEQRALEEKKKVHQEVEEQMRSLRDKLEENARIENELKSEVQKLQDQMEAEKKLWETKWVEQFFFFLNRLYRIFFLKITFTLRQPDANHLLNFKLNWKEEWYSKKGNCYRGSGQASVSKFRFESSLISTSIPSRSLKD